MSKSLIFIAAFLLPATFLVVPFERSLAQSACTNQTDGKSRTQLEQELAACEAEITQLTAELNKARATSATFQSDIRNLEEKIRIARANIRNKNNQINLLTRDIATKQSEIATLESRLERGRKAIADILRKTNDISSYSLVEVMLSGKDFSEFFVDMDTYASTERALAQLFTELREIKDLTEAERQALNLKREQETAAKAALETSRKEIELDQREKERLLTISRNNERTYAQEVADRQAKAAQIRATLFPLANVDQAIPFGIALQYAEAASAKTGIRPAFLLAIIQQESALGANTGSCVITDLSSGQTRSIRTSIVFSNGIHPTRDLPPLRTILGDLGRNPLETRVSCPVAGVGGYGGAMGPAQFIPSTWNIIKNKLSNITGKTTPDPWNPEDAFMASAILLSDNMGSTGDRYTDERTAACRYYSGQTCYVGGRAGRGLSYGNQVMNRAAAIQRDIDFLQSI